MFLEEIFKPCLTALATRYDLTKYSTPLAADDYDDLRRALGYARVNVTGGSYGTRMALVYMRQYPESVRTATLSGVLPMANKNPLNHPAGLDFALRGLLNECAAESACRTAVPKLNDELHVILARLDARPAATFVVASALLTLVDG